LKCSNHAGGEGTRFSPEPTGPGSSPRPGPLQRARKLARANSHLMTECIVIVAGRVGGAGHLLE